MRWFEAVHADWSPTTAYLTRSIIDVRLAGLACREVRSITTEDLDWFYAALRARGGRGGGPLSPATVTRIHSIVRLAFEQAVRWDWRADNPAARARPGRSAPARISPPTAADVRRLLEAAEAKDRELLTYLFVDAETGARRGELAALRLTDFGDAEVTIARSLAIGLDTAEVQRTYAGRTWSLGVRRGNIPTALIEKATKNDRSIRTISLAAPTLLLVAEQRQRNLDRALQVGVPFAADGFLFPATVDRTRPLRPDTWTARFGALRDSLGLSTRLHDLRHFVATTLLTAGVDLATVAGRLGHGGGGKTTLAIYAHFLRAPDRVASDLMAQILTPDRDSTANVIRLDDRRRRHIR